MARNPNAELTFGVHINEDDQEYFDKLFKGLERFGKKTSKRLLREAGEMAYNIAYRKAPVHDGSEYPTATNPRQPGTLKKGISVDFTPNSFYAESVAINPIDNYDYAFDQEKGPYGNEYFTDSIYEALQWLYIEVNAELTKIDGIPSEDDDFDESSSGLEDNYGGFF